MAGRSSTPKIQPTKAGQVYGRLTAIEFVGINRHREHRWRFSCSCGGETIIPAKKARSGHTQSCGCYRSEISAAQGRENSTHGRHGTPEHTSWCSMRQRCENEHHQDYLDYGGRGILVCERWRKFENFYADMGQRPSLKHSIDRHPNNDGNYEPGNCRWATMTQQHRNKRTNHLVDLHGRKMPMSEAAELLGLKTSTLWRRFKRGWAPERALTSGDARKDRV